MHIVLYVLGIAVLVLVMAGFWILGRLLDFADEADQEMYAEELNGAPPPKRV